MKDDVAYARFAERHPLWQEIPPEWTRLAVVGIPAALEAVRIGPGRTCQKTALEAEGRVESAAASCAFRESPPSMEESYAPWEQECRIMWPGGYGEEPACKAASTLRDLRLPEELHSTTDETKLLQQAANVRHEKEVLIGKRNKIELQLLRAQDIYRTQKKEGAGEATEPSQEDLNTTARQLEQAIIAAEEAHREIVTKIKEKKLPIVEQESEHQMALAAFLDRVKATISNRAWDETVWKSIRDVMDHTAVVQNLKRVGSSLKSERNPWTGGSDSKEDEKEPEARTPQVNDANQLLTTLNADRTDDYNALREFVRDQAIIERFVQLVRLELAKVHSSKNKDKIIETARNVKKIQLENILHIVDSESCDLTSIETRIRTIPRNTSYASASVSDAVADAVAQAVGHVENLLAQAKQEIRSNRNPFGEEQHIQHILDEAVILYPQFHGDLHHLRTEHKKGRPGLLASFLTSSEVAIAATGGGTQIPAQTQLQSDLDKVSGELRQIRRQLEDADELVNKKLQILEFMLASTQSELTIAGGERQKAPAAGDPANPLIAHIETLLSAEMERVLDSTMEIGADAPTSKKWSQESNARARWLVRVIHNEDPNLVKAVRELSHSEWIALLNRALPILTKEIERLHEREKYERQQEPRKILTEALRQAENKKSVILENLKLERLAQERERDSAAPTVWKNLRRQIQAAKDSSERERCATLQAEPWKTQLQQVRKELAARAAAAEPVELLQNMLEDKEQSEHRIVALQFCLLEIRLREAAKADDLKLERLVEEHENTIRSNLRLVSSKLFDRGYRRVSKALHAAGVTSENMPEVEKDGGSTPPEQRDHDEYVQQLLDWIGKYHQLHSKLPSKLLPLQQRGLHLQSLLRKLHLAEEESATQNGIYVYLKEAALDPANETLQNSIREAIEDATTKTIAATRASDALRTQVEDSGLHCRRIDGRCTPSIGEVGATSSNCELVVGPKIRLACTAVPANASYRVKRAVRLAYGLHGLEDPRAYLAQAGVRYAIETVEPEPVEHNAFVQSLRCKVSDADCAAPSLPPTMGGDSTSPQWSHACMLQPQAPMASLDPKMAANNYNPFFSCGRDPVVERVAKETESSMPAAETAVRRARLLSLLRARQDPLAPTPSSALKCSYRPEDDSCAPQLHAEGGEGSAVADGRCALLLQPQGPLCIRTIADATYRIGQAQRLKARLATRN